MKFKLHLIISILFFFVLSVALSATSQASSSTVEIPIDGYFTNLDGELVNGDFLLSAVICHSPDEDNLDVLEPAWSLSGDGGCSSDNPPSYGEYSTATDGYFSTVLSNPPIDYAVLTLNNLRIFLFVSFDDGDSWQMIVSENGLGLVPTAIAHYAMTLEGNPSSTFLKKSEAEEFFADIIQDTPAADFPMMKDENTLIVNKGSSFGSNNANERYYGLEVYASGNSSTNPGIFYDRQTQQWVMQTETGVKTAIGGGGSSSVEDIWINEDGDTGTGDFNFTNAIFLGENPLAFEGNTNDDYQTKFKIIDPTSDNEITFPDASGQVAFTADIPNTADLANTLYANEFQGVNTFNTSPVLKNGITLQPDGSSNLLLKAALGMTADYTFEFPSTAGTPGYVLQTDGSGATSWISVSAAASGANLNLSNLVPTSINTSLVPISNNGLDVGSSSNSWKDIYLGSSIIHRNGNSTTVSFATPTADRSIIVPNSSGTLALLTDIPSVSSFIANSSTPNAAGDISGSFSAGLTIDNDSINAATIATGAVGADEIATNAVTSEDIANGTITSNDIAAGAIESSQITGGAVDISTHTNLVAGGNITLTNDTLDVDDVFLMNTGDTATGTYSFNDNVNLGSSNADDLTINSEILGDYPLIFQGATDNVFTTRFYIADPTTNRTLTFPNQSGTIALTTDLPSLSGFVQTGDSPTWTGSHIFDLAVDFKGNLSDSTGDLTLSDNVVVTGTVDLQSALSDSNSDLTINDGLVLTGNISDSNSDVTIADGLIVTGMISDTDSDLILNDNVNVVGHAYLGDSNSDMVTLNGVIQGQYAFVFEGVSIDSFQTALMIADPTADNTILLQDTSGTLAMLSDLPEFSGVETITGNWINTASPWADNEVADNLTLSGGAINNSPIGQGTAAAGSFTTLSSNGNTTIGDDTASDTLTFNATLQGLNPLILEGATPDAFETVLQIQDPTADRTITIPNSSGILAFTSDLPDLTGYVATTTNPNAAGDISGDYSSGLTLDNNVVGSAEISTGAVETDEIANEAVTTDKIYNNTITSYDIAVGAIQSTQLANNAVDISTHTNLVAGANITLTNDTLDVDDAFLLNTGDTGSGNYTFSDSVVLGSNSADDLTINAEIKNSIPLVFQGSTDDAFTTSLVIQDPTASQTLTLPNTTGVIAVVANIPNLSGYVRNIDNPNVAGDISGDYNSGLTIDDNAITSAEIATGAVNTSDLATGAVTTDAIADGAVTDSKVSDTLTIGAAGSVHSSALSTNILRTNLAATIIEKFQFNSGIAFQEIGGAQTVTLQATTGIGSDYTLYLPSDTGINNFVLTTDGNGNLTWTSKAAGAGADAALSNLAAVAINTSLLPNADNSIDLGSATKRWNELYLGNGIQFEGATNTTALLFANPTSDRSIYLQDASGTLAFLSDIGDTSSIVRTDVDATISAQHTLTNGIHMLEYGGGSAKVTLATTDVIESYSLVLPVNAGNNNQVLTTDGSGNLSWTSKGGGSGADTSLSNLSAVAINTSLLPNLDNAIDLGSSSKNWNELYLSSSINFKGTTNTTTLQFSDPSSNRSVIVPNSSGTVALISDIPSLTGYVTVTTIPNAAGDISGDYNSGLTIDADAVDSSEIATGAVGSSEIANGAVDTSELASNAVTSDKIANGTITSYDIASNAVESSQIAAAAVDISTHTNLIAGTNITLTNDTLNVDDAFLLNTGDTATGNFAFNDNVSLGSNDTDELTINAEILGGNPFTLQGASNDGATTILSVADPTVDRTQIFQNASGTIALLSDIPSLTGYVQIGDSPTWTGTHTFNNVISAPTINTGNGNNEVYAMNQNVRSSDGVTFATVNTGVGDNELFPMNQSVTTTSNVTFQQMQITSHATIGNEASDQLAVTSVITGESALKFEGATVNAFSTTLAITDPTVSNKTQYLQNASGTIALLSDIPSLAGYVQTGDSPTWTGNHIFNNAIDVKTSLVNSAGTLTLNDNVAVTGTIDTQGALSNSLGDFSIADALTITGNISDSNSDVTIQDGLIVTGSVSDSNSALVINDDINITGTTVLGDAATDLITVTGYISGANAISFEGAVADSFYTTLAFTEPSQINTITFPDATGVVALTSDLVLGSSIDTNEIVNGTIQSIDIANNDIDFVDLANSMTVDAAFSITQGANTWTHTVANSNYTINLGGTGNFSIQDGGDDIASFVGSDGSMTLGKATVASTISIGFGSAADTISIGTGTGADVISLGASTGSLSIGAPTTLSQQTTLTKNPASTATSDASLYVNASGAANEEHLFVAAVSGTSKFSVDEDGDVSMTGIITGNGSGLTSLNGDNISSGTIDAGEIEDNTLTANDLAANSVGTSEITDGSIGSNDVNSSQAFTFNGVTSNSNLNVNGNLNVSGGMNQTINQIDLNTGGSAGSTCNHSPVGECTVVVGATRIYNSAQGEDYFGVYLPTAAGSPTGTSIEIINHTTYISRIKPAAGDTILKEKMPYVDLQPQAAVECVRFEASTWICTKKFTTGSIGADDVNPADYFQFTGNMMLGNGAADSIDIRGGISNGLVNVTVNDSIDVSGDANITGDANISTNLYVNGTIYDQGDTIVNIGENLTVSGSITSTGTIDISSSTGSDVPHDCTWVLPSGSNSKDQSASCAADYTLISGGCKQTSATNQLEESYRSSNTWVCAWGGDGGTKQAQAHCCKF